MKTINLGFRIKDVVKSHSNFKLLFNDHRIKIALMYDGKYIYEYDYHHMVENSRINLIELNETKLAINATLS